MLILEKKKKKHILIPELFCLDFVFHSTTSVFEFFFLFMSFLWLFIAGMFRCLFCSSQRANLFFIWICCSFDVNHRDAKAKINCFWLVWSHNWHPNTPCFYCSYKNFKKQLQNQFYISPCVSLYFHLFLKVS